VLNIKPSMSKTTARKGMARGFEILDFGFEI